MGWTQDTQHIDDDIVMMMTMSRMTIRMGTIMTMVTIWMTPMRMMTKTMTTKMRIYLQRFPVFAAAPSAAPLPPRVKRISPVLCDHHHHHQWYDSHRHHHHQRDGHHDDQLDDDTSHQGQVDLACVIIILLLITIMIMKTIRLMMMKWIQVEIQVQVRGVHYIPTIIRVLFPSGMLP